jgi:hypothetical protein
MESKILSFVGKVAGLGGIALGVLLLLFQGVLQKEFLPKAGLESGQAFAVILSLMIMTFGIAGIGVIGWLVSRAAASTVPVPAPTLLILAALIAGVVGAAVFVSADARNAKGKTDGSGKEAPTQITVPAAGIGGDARNAKGKTDGSGKEAPTHITVPAAGIGADARNAKGKTDSSGKEAPTHITVPAAGMCPEGYTIFYQVRTESETGTGFNLPAGVRVCIVDSSIKTKSGDNVLVRDEKPSPSSSDLRGPNGSSDKICRIMFDAIDKDPRNFNYPMSSDKKPADCAARARVMEGGYGATHARIGCGYTSYVFGAPFSIFQTKEDLIRQTAFEGLDLKCGWE